MSLYLQDRYKFGMRKNRTEMRLDMTEGTIIAITKETLWVIIKTSAPLLLISLVIGLIISIFQTVTSIQEQTLTFVPKILAVFIGLMFFGSWMMNSMVSFTQTLWSNFAAYTTILTP